jgi:phytanoyl-CoA hydroxylase
VLPHLSAAQQSQFEQEGYVVVEDVFDPEQELDPVIEEYDGVLDTLATELLESGAISSTYPQLAFSDRLARIYAETGKVYPKYFDLSLPQRGVTHQTPFWTGPAVFALLRSTGVLDRVESLIGPEIYSNPVQHIRLLPPERLVPTDPSTGRALLAATPWHQDNGVVTEEADDTEMITVWFPLLDTTEEMGCLVVQPGSHRRGLLTHCGGGRLHVPDQLVGAAAGTPLPMARGSALFMHRRTLHSSLPNRSTQVRRSFDLRYHPTGQPTGRPAFPGFVARSRSRPDTELRDPEVWTARWLEARRALADSDQPRFNRWDANAAVCA